MSPRLSFRFADVLSDEITARSSGTKPSPRRTSRWSDMPAG